MAKYAFPILFTLVLVTPFVLRQTTASIAPVSVEVAGQVAGAATAASEPLKIITPNTEGIRREFAAAFNDWHQKTFGTRVDIQYLNFGGASDIVKYFDANKITYQQLGTYNVDLAWGGGDTLFDVQLKKPGYLAPTALDPAVMAAAFPKDDLGGLALFDRGNPASVFSAGFRQLGIMPSNSMLLGIVLDGFGMNPRPSWFGTALSSFGICYNRDVVHYLGVPEPKTWRDLTNPRYINWLVAADPTSSSSSKAAFLAIVEKAMADASARGRSEDDGWADGMGLIRQIAANCRLFTDGSGVVPNLIGSGDVAAGMSIDFYARSQAAAVGTDRMGYVEPLNATVINPDAIAMIRGAEHPRLARQFISFVLSEQGQRLWKQKPGTEGGPRKTALWREPIMPAIYDLPPDLLTDTVNPFRASSTFNKKFSREGTFGILGELIEFSCMDLLDDLRETRKVILTHDRPDLDAKLGKFPFDQTEALARLKAWNAATPLDRLDLKRRWTDEFRTEYANLRRAAESNSASGN
jgi:ABC-type Fe3+ transport system substrate-binding protein